MKNHDRSYCRNFFYLLNYSSCNFSNSMDNIDNSYCLPKDKVNQGPTRGSKLNLKYEIEITVKLEGLATIETQDKIYNPKYSEIP